jgi:hypothetical protein
MNQLLRLGVVGGLVAAAILIVALGIAQHHAALMGPVDLMLFLLGVAVYLLPAGLALYRDCKATAWIALVNITLGWTILGWFAALGWAASGSVRPAAPAMTPPPIRPATGH